MTSHEQNDNIMAFWKKSNFLPSVCRSWFWHSDAFIGTPRLHSIIVFVFPRNSFIQKLFYYTDARKTCKIVNNYVYYYRFSSMSGNIKASSVPDGQTSSDEPTACESGSELSEPALSVTCPQTSQNNKPIQSVGLHQSTQPSWWILPILTLFRDIIVSEIMAKPIGL